MPRDQRENRVTEAWRGGKGESCMGSQRAEGHLDPHLLRSLVSSSPPTSRQGQPSRFSCCSLSWAQPFLLFPPRGQERSGFAREKRESLETQSIVVQVRLCGETEGELGTACVPVTIRNQALRPTSVVSSGLEKIALWPWRPRWEADANSREKKCQRLL